MNRYILYYSQFIFNQRERKEEKYQHYSGDYIQKPIENRDLEKKYRKKAFEKKNGKVRMGYGIKERR